ncbi:endonuclease/exonuclease/phosphatase family protein [Brachybacterium subflavum]|uniref:endonuclease/exonuclease/phosphatase family protein n=1 Tax=Brachybacterium subflavum TaxID=2585206 RepID=UPI00187A1E1F|nr:endonuclease/exonuclease/phosphatase family protein [Brachybacterium subflavum]
MRIATLNTWGTRGDWPERRAEMVRQFCELDPDIITLQETVLHGGLDQAREIVGNTYFLAQQTDRESGGRGVPPGQGITIASRWPLGQVVELNLHVTERTGNFACACLIAEVLAPAPLGRVWVANHFPDYQLDHEVERQMQAVIVARALEGLVAEKPGHVIVAGDMDAEPDSSSLRFWAGLQALGQMSVCYRSVVDAAGREGRIPTYVPENPFQADPDWPFCCIDHLLVRCASTGPTLLTTSCRRTFDAPAVSDHYGLVADLSPAPDTSGIEH